MNVHLGATLREAREHEGIEQRDLADLLGVGESTISKVENGHRTLSATEFLTLGLIFHTWFDMETHDLVGELTADLAARLREYLDKTDFRPVEFHKRDWLTNLLTQLDRGIGEDA